MNVNYYCSWIHMILIALECKLSLKIMSMNDYKCFIITSMIINIIINSKTYSPLDIERQTEWIFFQKIK